MPGMNTGIQDAHNLAWKIASVIRGIAPTSMLDTYEIERKPVRLLSPITFFECVYILMLDKLIEIYCCIFRLLYSIQD